MKSIAERIAAELNVRVTQVDATIALLDGKATVPFIARYRKEATGGLDDTIDLWDARSKKGTGFKFQEYMGDALMRTIHQALTVYRDHDSWQKLMRNGMAKDFSWGASGSRYVALYDSMRRGELQGRAVIAF